jgi:hypothetical protein
MESLIQFGLILQCSEVPERVENVLFSEFACDSLNPKP